MKERMKPGPGQESVWDYPRPPRLDPISANIEIMFGGETIAQTDRAFRVLETSHPPTFYLPPDSIRSVILKPSGHASFCEWKGRAEYYSVHIACQEITNAAWSYPVPTQPFARIAGYFAFYPSKMDGCYVDGERVRSQDGDFYGGWITGNVVGPFKGGPGTSGW